MKKHPQKNGKKKTPFFAQLLTRQEMIRTAAGNDATKPYLDIPEQTMKWPSDGDESTPLNDSVDY